MRSPRAIVVKEWKKVGLPVPFQTVDEYDDMMAANAAHRELYLEGVCARKSPMHDLFRGTSRGRIKMWSGEGFARKDGYIKFPTIEKMEKAIYKSFEEGQAVVVVGSNGEAWPAVVIQTYEFPYESREEGACRVELSGEGWEKGVVMVRLRGQAAQRLSYRPRDVVPLVRGARGEPVMKAGGVSLWLPFRSINDEGQKVQEWVKAVALGRGLSGKLIVELVENNAFRFVE
jgi:hypothetical protein